MDSPGAGSVTGSGTDNYIPKWNGTTALENSIICTRDYRVVVNGGNLSSYATNRQILEVYGTGGTADFDGGITNLSAGSSTNAHVVGRLAFINAGNANHVSPTAAAGSRIAQIITTVVTTDSNAGGDSGGDLQFWTKPEAGAPAERMRILSGGKVGIGTTVPATPLDVNGIITTRDLINLGSAGVYGQLTWLSDRLILRGASGKALSLGANGAWDKLFIDTAGKVGINDTTPTYQLDVNGTFRVVGAATFNSTVSTGAITCSTIQTSSTATFNGNVFANGNNFYYSSKIITSSYVSVFDVNNTSGLSTDFSFSVKGTANSCSDSC